MLTLIRGGELVNEGRTQRADVVIEGDTISRVLPGGGAIPGNSDFDEVIDAKGCLVLPGVIDTHVHFREPGLTHKATMETESRAAKAGGVTSVLEMPNTAPQTTSAEALREKLDIARRKMHINYAFFPGATNDNLPFLRSLDPHAVPGIKLFMGSSTGGMLVDGGEPLEAVFALAAEMGLPLMTHCEDTATINRNMAHYKSALATDDPEVALHPLIRSREACVKSSALAVRLAEKYGTRLHIAHISTKEETELLRGRGPLITGEATVAHLMFSDRDYERLGALIKCNPAIKTAADCQALREAAADLDSPIFTIGTDHAPHTLEEKCGGAARAMSGMPSVQYALPAVLELAEQGVLTVERAVSLMCHNPATLFSMSRRGFVREGYKADLTIVRRNAVPWTVERGGVQSLCKWSPFEGMKFHWSVERTVVNGGTHGEPLRFRE